MGKRDFRVSPYITGVGYALIFGFSFMASKVALRWATPFQMVGIRYSIAAMILVVLWALRIIKVKLTRKHLLMVLPIAILQPILYAIGETYGVAYTSSSMAGTVTASVPVVTAFLAAVFINEKLNGKQIWFVVLSFLGIILISVFSLTLESANMALGLAFLGLAVIAASMFHVLARKATQVVSPTSVTFVMVVLSGLVFSAVGIGESCVKGYAYLAPLANTEFLIAILFLSIFTVNIALFLMTYTVRHISASQNAMFANLVTVISIIAGAVFLKEQILLYQIIGSVMIIAGVWGANYFADKA